ncbi:hypothetical protein NQ315_001671 [Exocentrus adspersus]|uniref:Uncharacterized protein n=1 Tax=Exocentrus adspersus TaxID=1586481 RepID=A0AAV8W9X1_9CUCU|nr:hypothetical protein NQ315_001671 [Exocentrus adspersus]
MYYVSRVNEERVKRTGQGSGGHLLWIVLLVVLCSLLSESKPNAKNHDLLAKIGLQKIRGPNTHHRKRLAVESRHHSRSDDSHMFIIKLPPKPHYYDHIRPASFQDIHSRSKDLPVGFKSNGKPAKIYHWNIPLLKKMAAKHKPKGKGYNDVDIQDPESWNEVLDKPVKEKKPLKPSYYVPAKPKKSGFTKYFAGNGKPHSFYVIEKSKKAHYHRLLP